MEHASQKSFPKFLFISLGAVAVLLFAILVFSPVLFPRHNPQNMVAPSTDKKEKKQTVAKPTEREMEIYNYYWSILDQPGNPSGPSIHPFWLEDANSWEKTRIKNVMTKYNLSNDQLADIVSRVIAWRYQ